MDFIDGLPSSRGKTTIFVVVDNVFKLHGMPQTIVCDRDPVFISLFWRELFNLQGTRFNFSSAYHPQTDGQTEVVNRTLEMYLM